MTAPAIDRVALIAAAKGVHPPARPVRAGVRVLTPAPAASAAVTKTPIDRAEPDGQIGIEELLTKGEASRNQRTRTLAARARTVLQELESCLRTETAAQQIEDRLAKLRAELAAEEEALRELRGGRRPTKQADDTEQTDKETRQRIRMWAEANGIEVSPRGRIRTEVIDQWRAATGRAG